MIFPLDKMKILCNKEPSGWANKIGENSFAFLDELDYLETIKKFNV